MIAAQQNQTRGRSPGSAPETRDRLDCVRCGRDGHVSANYPWPMRLGSTLPLDVARCMPASCAQSDRCARANDWPTGSPLFTIVDASVTIAKLGMCPMFVDTHGAGVSNHDGG